MPCTMCYMARTLDSSKSMPCTVFNSYMAWRLYCTLVHPMECLCEWSPCHGQCSTWHGHPITKRPCHALFYKSCMAWRHYWTLHAMEWPGQSWRMISMAWTIYSMAWTLVNNVSMPWTHIVHAMERLRQYSSMAWTVCK